MDAFFKLKDNVLEYGPLPNQWRAVIEEDDTLFYQHQQGGDKFENHPFSPAFSFHNPDVKIARAAAPEHCIGILSPPHSDAQDFTWHSELDGYLRAFAWSMSKTFDATSGAMVCPSYEALEDSRNKIVQEQVRLPHTLYDFRDQQTALDLKHAKKERILAKLARDSGFALVIVDSGVTCTRQYATHGPRPDIKVRWSYGAGYELWPPVFVGICGDLWFGLETNKNAIPEDI